MITPLQEIASLGFSFLSLLGAGAFFWIEKKIAGFAFLVAFIVSFSAMLHQRVVLTSAVVGVTVEHQTPTKTASQTE
jgi:hypothetical protein